MLAQFLDAEPTAPPGATSLDAGNVACSKSNANPFERPLKTFKTKELHRKWPYYYLNWRITCASPFAKESKWRLFPQPSLSQSDAISAYPTRDRGILRRAG